MSELPDRLRSALRTALAERDREAMSALRSTLAAIENAEAVDAGTASAGTAEVARKILTGDELRSIVAGEVSDRRAAAEAYQRSGRSDRADLLRRGAAIIERVLD